MKALGTPTITTTTNGGTIPGIGGGGLVEAVMASVPQLGQGGGTLPKAGSSEWFLLISVLVATGVGALSARRQQTV